MPTIKVVNITPKALSGDTNLDSEPNLAVDPENPLEMVATAFTPDPMNGPLAPVYVSTDGGDTWVLNSVVPGNGALGTGDISVGFGGAGGRLYTGILNGQSGDLQILRAPDITASTPMAVLVDRSGEDQPWVVATTVTANGGSGDRVYIGSNDVAQPGGTATVDVSNDAGTGPAPAGFAPVKLDRHTGTLFDGPPVRIAAHPDGTIYVAFLSVTATGAGALITFDVVMTRDDKGGVGPNPFEDLLDSAVGDVGQRVVTGRKARFNPHQRSLGQERTGADLAVAVDPTDSNSVWIAYCDNLGGTAPTDYVLHSRHSADRGQTWAAARPDVVNGKNPSLAVNSDGLVGLVYQQLVHNQWSTVLELTADGFGTTESHVLHQAPGDVPPAGTQLPYLGDYLRMVTVGKDFYGVFAGNNTPDRANFPVGVTYQRNANFTTHQLLSSDGVTRVPPSIDPFFFHRAA
ncbi:MULTISPECIES: hypothetical protein [Streptomycetaceae]|uniref:hypothetical protein n=1 Tax=Streptomycetaceae TaxID=2062 RepID=UPI000670D528|nr:MULTISPECIES: hypothetical protein [Streptomycetaceae]OKI05831.1 hypothetical protein AMK13_21380 [Streptomyces sp. CB02056]